MGFRKDAYATVWEIEPVSNTRTKGRISISRKNKETGEYETDFSGFVAFLGTNAASKALSLKEKDRIRLGDVDVSTRYVKEKETTYTNFSVFSFEMADGFSGANASGTSTPAPKASDGDVEEDELPF